VAEAKKHLNVKLLTGNVTGVFLAIKERKPPRASPTRSTAAYSTF